MKSVLIFWMVFCWVQIAIGQSVSKITGALNSAKSQVSSVMTSVSNFLWIIAGIVAVFGAFKVFSKYQNQDQDTMKSLGVWAGGVIALVILNLIIKAVFV